MIEAQTISPRTRPTNSKRLVHIRELDGLRGIAALMVFFHHVCYTSIDPTQWGSGVRLLYRLSEFGSYGVDVFFVLSGFLITSLLIEDRANPAFYRNFYWKRALRILPLYAVCLIAIALLVPAARSYVLLCVFFISNFASWFHVYSNGPFWSLAIEEQFYLLWPTVVRKRTIAQLSRWTLGIAIGSILLRLVAASFGHHNYYLTFLHCDGLALGAYLACRREGRSQNSPGRMRATLLSLLLASAILLVAASKLPLGNPILQALSADAIQTALTLLSIVLLGHLITHSGSPHLAIFRSGPLPFLGLISYAVYMIHLYVMRTYDHLFGSLPHGILSAYLIRFFVIAGITLGFSLASRYLIELPATSLRKYVLKRPTSTQITPQG